MVVTDPFVAPLEELLHELGVIDQLHDVAVEQHDATWSGVLPTWRGKSKGVESLRSQAKQKKEGRTPLWAGSK